MNIKELTAQLRTKQEEKAELRKKRQELRIKLEGHRDANSDEYAGMRDEFYSYETKLDELNDSIDTLRSEIATAKLAKDMMEKPKAENATRSQVEEMLKSSEYRDAFFRSLANRRILDSDAEVMEFGKRTITDMNVGAIQEGAEYLIPTTTYNMIVSVIREYGQVYSAVTKTGFTGNIAIPIGEVKEKIENDDKTFTLKFGFTEVKITQGAIIGTLEVSNLLLKNSISALEGFLVTELGKQVALMLDNAVLFGDGGGSFEGIIPKLSITKYTKIDWDMIVAVEHGLRKIYSSTAAWIMNWATFGNFRKLKGLDNMPLTATTPIILGNGYSAPYSIDNKPVLIVDPAILPDDVILYGNLSAYRVNESQSMIIESDQSPGFTKDKTTYRAKVYSGGTPVLATENFVLYHTKTTIDTGATSGGGDA